MQGVKWGEYRIGDIFEKLPVKKAIKQDIRKYKNAEFNIPVVYCKFGDNGIMYWGRKNEFTTYENIISVIYNGAIAAGKVYAQKEKTGILAESYFIRLKDYKSTHNINLFFSTILEKRLYYKYSRDFLATWDNKVENDTIFLPIKDKKIDFDFIESFIAELEVQRIAELKAYLQVSGLDDYELSKDELEVLQKFETLEWETFNLKKIFGKSTRGKRLKSDDRIAGGLPFVTAGEASEGISAFIGNDVEVFDENTTTIDMFGSAKYRNYKYGADDHVAVVHTENIPKNASIFITSAIHKASYTGKFDYSNNFYAKDADELNILLPIKNSEPDFEYMKVLISAIHKLVIKDIVLYADKKIDATKKVVSKK